MCHKNQRDQTSLWQYNTNEKESFDNIKKTVRTVNIQFVFVPENRFRRLITAFQSKIISFLANL